jgi:acetyltransferase-like isoleucine patch superfamily enzyme
MSRLDPLRLRARRVATALVHRGWGKVSALGMVGPDDAIGRRFRVMGAGSVVAFPPGPTFGENWIAIGSATMVGAHVSMAAGMPGESLDRHTRPLVSIGDRCVIGRGSSIIGRIGIDIEDDVWTGPNVYITDHNHGYSDLATPIGRQWLVEAPVRIGEGSWLGVGVTVLPGSDIGRHVVVAAGSVVRGRVPDYSVVAGAPARIVRRHVEGAGWVPPIPARDAHGSADAVPGELDLGDAAEVVAAEVVAAEVVAAEALVAEVVAAEVLAAEAVIESAAIRTP